MNVGRKLKPVTHVIFDLDGVILDTERLYTQATQNIVGKYGKTFTWSEKSQIMGLIGLEAATRVVELLNLPITPQEYYELAKKQYALVMQDAELLPGAANLIKHLNSHKIPIAVETSSSQDSFDLKTAKHKDLFKLFHHIVCGGSDPDVKEGKPKPDIFLVCASRFPDKPNPEKCLVFEDAPNGINAAITAGMQTVMIPDENVPIELQKDAHIKVKSLEQVPLDLFGLPPLKKCNMH